MDNSKIGTDDIETYIFDEETVRRNVGRKEHGNRDRRQFCVVTIDEPFLGANEPHEIVVCGSDHTNSSRWGVRFSPCFGGCTSYIYCLVVEAL